MICEEVVYNANMPGAKLCTHMITYSRHINLDNQSRKRETSAVEPIRNLKLQTWHESARSCVVSPRTQTSEHGNAMTRILLSNLCFRQIKFQDPGAITQRSQGFQIRTVAIPDQSCQCPGFGLYAMFKLRQASRHVASRVEMPGVSLFSAVEEQTLHCCKVDSQAHFT